MLGDVRTTQEIVGYSGTAAGAVVPAVAGSSIAGAVGLSTAVAVPLIGAVIAGITFGIMQFTQGCQSCIVTSDQANKIEDLMKQNLAAWQGSNKTCAEKQQCLSNFDQLWDALVQFCSNPQFGGAGKNCIGDRQEGACHYGTYPNCWNWFVGYRDPIANDSCSNQQVVSNLGTSILPDVSSIVSSSTGFDWTTILAIGLVIVGIGFSD